MSGVYSFPCFTEEVNECFGLGFKGVNNVAESSVCSVCDTKNTEVIHMFLLYSAAMTAARVVAVQFVFGVIVPPLAMFEVALYKMLLTMNREPVV